MIKLGLDLHGVIDCNPDFFISLSELIEKFNGEVHIITGTPWGEAEKVLLSYNNGKKWWNYFFSIDDYLRNMNIPFEIDKKGGRDFDLDEWNKAKSIYCKEQGIDLHIDDSVDYGKPFITPYLCVSTLPQKIKKFS